MAAGYGSLGVSGARARIYAIEWSSGRLWMMPDG